jgi:signal transduction histidine kinase
MMLERALVNLVENAIKYTPEAGSILVRAYLDSGALILSVIDNGLGIPPEKQATIFDKGSRVRRDEHRQVRGSGLGLFIVRNVAQQHGGDALLYSMEGEGSEFQIIIPLLGPNLIKP